MNSIRFVAAVLVLVALAGCDDTDLTANAPAEWRRLVVTVSNESPWSATLSVADPITGRVVGIASPSSVPAGRTEDVTFAFPQGQSWGMFVNAGPGQRPLVTDRDVPPDAEGPMPFQLGVAEDGGLGVARDLNPGPGWFGN